MNSKPHCLIGFPKILICTRGRGLIYYRSLNKVNEHDFSEDEAGVRMLSTLRIAELTPSAIRA